MQWLQKPWKHCSADITYTGVCSTSNTQRRFQTSIVARLITSDRSWFNLQQKAHWVIVGDFGRAAGKLNLIVNTWHAMQKKAILIVRRWRKSPSHLAVHLTIFASRHDGRMKLPSEVCCWRNRGRQSFWSNFTSTLLSQYFRVLLLL